MATGQENRDNQQPGVTQGAAGGQTGPEWDALKGDVADAAGAAMEQGRHFLDSAREQATGYVDHRKNDIAEAVVAWANTVRESGNSFEHQPSIKAVVESAAGGLEQLADTIREQNLGDIFGGVEDMVRRRPAAAAVATMAAGFLLSRFVKASLNGRGSGPGAGQRGAQAGFQARSPSRTAAEVPLSRSRAATGGGGI